MIPKRYPIRAIKSILMFLLLAFFVFVVSFLLDKQIQLKNVDAFWQFLQQSRLLRLIIFLVVFGLIYPFIGYIAQKVALSRPFTDDDKETIKKIFTDARYVLEKDEDGKMVFRTTNPVARVTRMFEDAIEVDYSGNLLVVEGLRRDTSRLSRAIDWQLRRANDDDPKPESEESGE